jgi:hypothetical protein
LFVEDQDDVNEQILSISGQLFPEDVVWMDMCLIVPLIQMLTGRFCFVIIARNLPDISE